MLGGQRKLRYHLFTDISSDTHNCFLTFNARPFNPVLCFKYVITRHILPSPLPSQGNVILKHTPHFFFLLGRTFIPVLFQTDKIGSCLCTLRSSTGSLTQYTFTLNMTLKETLTLILVSYLKTHHNTKTHQPLPTCLTLQCLIGAISLCSASSWWEYMLFPLPSLSVSCDRGDVPLMYIGFL